MSDSRYVQSEKARKNYLIPQIRNNMPAVTPPVYERYTKEQLEELIVRNYGIITVICSLADCTYKQLYGAIDRYELRDVLAEAKQQLVGIAEKAVLDCLNSESEKIKLEAARHTLNSLGRSQGWGNDQTVINQQINIKDKTAEIKNIFGIQ